MKKIMGFILTIIMMFSTSFPMYAMETDVYDDNITEDSMMNGDESHKHSLYIVFGSDVGSLNNYYQCSTCNECFEDMYGYFTIDDLELYKKTIKGARAFIDNPIAGQKHPNVTGKIEGQYNVYIMDWTDSNGIWYSPDAILKENETYTVTIRFVAAEGYVFDKDTITVNGTNYEIYGNNYQDFYSVELTLRTGEGHKHSLTYVTSNTLNPYYTCGCGKAWYDANAQSEISNLNNYKKTIYNASFTVNPPAAGQPLDFNPVSANPSLYNRGVVTWSYNKGEISSHSGYIVENDTKYKLLIAIIPNGDYIIDQSTVRINGELTTAKTDGYLLMFNSQGHVHHPQYVAQVDATCTEHGIKAHYECSCEDWFEDEHGINKIPLHTQYTIFSQGHKWDDGQITTKPTFTSKGERTYTCLNDVSHTKTEEIPMLEETHLEGYSLSVSGNIGVNFYMALSDETANNPNTKMTFALPNGTTTQMSISDASIIDGYYVFTCYVSAKEMRRPIVANINTASGNQSYTFTVYDYAFYILDHEQQYDANVVKIVRAMMSYGKTAQEYFDYFNTSDQKPQNGYSTLYHNYDDYAHVLNDTNENLTYVGARLVLSSKPALKLYFVGNENFMVNGKTVSTTTEGNYTVVTILDIDDMEAMYTISAPNFSLQYSIFSYAKQAQATGNEQLNNLMNAMYLYDQSLKHKL